MSDETGSEPPTNVVDLAEKKRQRKAASMAAPGDKGPTIMDNVRMVSEAMFGTPGLLPPFPAKFWTQLDARGELQILEEMDGRVFKYVGKTRVKSAICRYIHDDCKWAEGMSKLSPAHMGWIYEFWAARAPEAPEIAPCRLKAEEGPTFHRLPFDVFPDPEHENTPLWREILERADNAAALEAWIGSLFDPQADLQQYLWLHGSGQNGKSSIGRFVAAALGPTTRWAQPPNEGDRFWTLGIMGKRLVIFGDCNRPRFVTSDLFKGLTGGDEIQVEVKGGATFSAKLATKFLFFSNKKPAIDGDLADQRRVIYCGLSGIASPPSRDYEARLWAEAPWILGRCLEAYYRHAGSGVRIRGGELLAQEIARDNDDVLETIFEMFFEESESAADTLPPATIYTLVRSSNLLSEASYKRFLEYIRRDRGVEYVRGFKTARKYTHIKCRPKSVEDWGQ